MGTVERLETYFYLSCLRFALSGEGDAGLAAIAAGKTMRSSTLDEALAFFLDHLIELAAAKNEGEAEARARQLRSTLTERKKWSVISAILAKRAVMKVNRKYFDAFMSGPFKTPDGEVFLIPKEDLSDLPIIAKMSLWMNELSSLAGAEVASLREALLRRSTDHSS